MAVDFDLLDPPSRFGVHPQARLWGFRILFWTLILTGPIVSVFLIGQVETLSRQVATTADLAVPVVADTAAVEGYAELVVADHLTAHQDSPVLATTSLGAVEVHPGYYAVTVAVTSQLESGGATDDERSVRTYTIGIAATGDGWAPVGRPAMVAQPRQPEIPDTAVTPSLGGLRSVPGLEDTVVGFLTGYLTGAGDPTRYATPGIRLDAVSPPPFTTLELTQAGSIPRGEGQRLVVVTVEGIDTTGRTLTLDYSFLLTLKEGRWEIAEILPAQPLTDTD